MEKYADKLTRLQFIRDQELAEDIINEHKKADKMYLAEIEKGNFNVSRLDFIDIKLIKRISEYNFISACIDGNLKKVKKILKVKNSSSSNFVDINCKGVDGVTGLEYACLYDNDSVEKYLLKKGATQTEQYLKIKQEREETLKNLSYESNLEK